MALHRGAYPVCSLSVTPRVLPTLLMPELVALRALATRTINEHTGDHGLCVVCGAAWPCERAVLAEHNLGFLWVRDG